MKSRNQSTLDNIKSICFGTSESKTSFESWIKFFFTVKNNEVYFNLGSSEMRDEKDRGKILEDIWKDIRRKFIFNSKSQQLFKLWLEWLATIDKSQVSLLSIPDTMVRTKLIENEIKYQQIFNDAMLSESQAGVLELELLELFLKRELGDHFYELIINKYLQGTGVIAAQFWAPMLGPAFESGTMIYEQSPTSQIYQYNGNLYARAVSTTMRFSKKEKNEVGGEALKEFASIPTPPFGAVKIQPEGMKVLEVGGTYSVNEKLRESKAPQFQTTFGEFKQLVESEQDTLEKEFKNIKRDLITHYKNFLPDLLSPQTFHDLQLLLKHLEDIKDLPNIHLANYNESLQEINQFLRKPTTSTQKIIQEKISHFYHLLLLEKQKILGNNFISKFNDLEPDHPLKQKFGLINFKYLDEIIQNPNAKFFNLPDIIDRLNTVMENFSKSEEKYSDKPTQYQELNKIIQELECINQNIKDEKTFSLRVSFITTLKKLEWHYNKYKTTAQNNTTAETFNEIRLFIKLMDKIKNLPNLPAAKTTQAINEISNFLKNPQSHSALKIQNYISQFYSAMMADQKQKIAEKFNTKCLSEMKCQDRLNFNFQKVTDILDTLIKLPNAKNFNLPKIMEEIDCKLDEFHENKTEKSIFADIQLSETEKIVSIEKNNEPEVIYKEYITQYQLKFPDGKVITDEIVCHTPPNKSDPEYKKSILKILAKRGHIPDNLENYLENTLEKLASINLQMQRDLQMEDYKFLRNIVDDCFEKRLEELKKTDKNTNDVEKIWNCLRVSFSRKDPQDYIKLVATTLQISTKGGIGEILQRALQHNYPDFSKKFKIDLPLKTPKSLNIDFFKKKSSAALKPAQSTARYSTIAAIL